MTFSTLITENALKKRKAMKNSENCDHLVVRCIVFEYFSVTDDEFNKYNKQNSLFLENLWKNLVCKNAQYLVKIL